MPNFFNFRELLYIKLNIIIHLLNEMKNTVLNYIIFRETQKLQDGSIGSILNQIKEYGSVGMCITAIREVLRNSAKSNYFSNWDDIYNLIDQKKDFTGVPEILLVASLLVYIKVSGLYDLE